MTETHQRILARLRVKHRGKENAIKRADLSKIIGISERELRRNLTQIDEQVEETICRDNHGVYVAVTTEEISRYAARCSSMGVKNIINARRSEKSSARKESPQRELFA